MHCVLQWCVCICKLEKEQWEGKSPVLIDLHLPYSYRRLVWTGDFPSCLYSLFFLQFHLTPWSLSLYVEWKKPLDRSLNHWRIDFGCTFHTSFLNVIAVLWPLGRPKLLPIRIQNLWKLIFNNKHIQKHSKFLIVNNAAEDVVLSIVNVFSFVSLGVGSLALACSCQSITL